MKLTFVLTPLAPVTELLESLAHKRPRSPEKPEPTGPRVEIFEDLEVLPPHPTARNNTGGISRWKSSFDIISGKPLKRKKQLHPDYAARKMVTSSIEIDGDVVVAAVANPSPSTSVSVITIGDDSGTDHLPFLPCLLSW